MYTSLYNGLQSCFYQNIKMTDESLITNKNRWENQKLQTFDLKVLF